MCYHTDFPSPLPQMKVSVIEEAIGFVTQKSKISFLFVDEIFSLNYSVQDRSSYNMHILQCSFDTCLKFPFLENKITPMKRLICSV